MSRFKKLAGETAIYGLTTIVGRLLNYLLVPFYTRVFLNESYGIITEIYAYVGFFNVLYTYRMETAFFRFGTDLAQREKAYATAAGTVAMTTIAFTLVFLLGAGGIANWLEYPDNPEYVRWMALVIGLDALTAIPFARLRLEGKALHFGKLKLINIGTNIGFNLFFLLWLPQLADDGIAWAERMYDPDFQVGYVFLSNLLASAITFAMLIPLYLRASFRFDFDTEQLRKMFYYAAPLIIVGFAGIVNETLDRVLLKQLLLGSLSERLAEIGTYGGCYKLAMLMTIFTMAFNYAAEPFFFRTAAQDDAKRVYAIVTKAFAVIGTFIFLGVMLYLDVVKLFLGESYREGLGVVPILLMANLFLGMYYNVAIWFKITDKTIIGTYISLVGAAVTILLNVLLIPFIGYMGAAWATFFCYFAMLYLTWYYGQRYYPVPYPIRRIFLYIVTVLAIYLLSDMFVTLFSPGLGVKLFFNTILLCMYAYFVYRLEENKLMRYILRR